MQDLTCNVFHVQLKEKILGHGLRISKHLTNYTYY